MAGVSKENNYWADDLFYVQFYKTIPGLVLAMNWSSGGESSQMTTLVW